MSPTVSGIGRRAWFLLAVPLLVLPVAGCSAPEASSASSVDFSVDGHQVIDPHQLQTAAEQELAYTTGFGYVSPSGAGPVQCWFAKTGLSNQVDERLWCGPVQIPGSPATNAWVPVPMKKVGENAGQIQLQVQAPDVPLAGNRSTPVGSGLQRADGSTLDPMAAGDRTAGANFIAVLADTDHKTNAELGLDKADSVKIHDDLLSATATGWGKPESFPLGDNATLRAQPGVQLRVLRLHVERPSKTEPGFQSQQWDGWQPQPSTLSLEVEGRRQVLPAERLPDKGDVFVLYTVPDNQQHPESLVLNTVGTQSLEQQLEIPSGKRSDGPAVLRRDGKPAQDVNGKQDIKVTTGSSYGDSPAGEHTGSLTVNGVRLGRQRPIKLDNGNFRLATASAPDKALLEVDLKAGGDHLPAIMGAMVTKDSITVTLPDNSTPPLVGVRYDGDLFPSAVIVEVPAGVKSVKVGLRTGGITLSALGKVDLAATSAPVDVPLNF